MSAETKAEAAPLRAFKHKTIGHRVCRRVTIGGRQHHQEGIPGLQHAVTDDTPIGKQTAECSALGESKRATSSTSAMTWAGAR